MLTSASTPAFQFWIWPFAVVSGLLAYWCSRGSDGRLVGSLVGFGLLGLSYWAWLWFSERSGMLTSLLHLVVMEVAVIIALTVNPQLEEMGGMLNYLIPAFIAVIVVVGWLVLLARVRGARIMIKGGGFQPGVATIRTGEQVTWINGDDRDHAIVAADGSFRSGNLSAGGSFDYTFRKAGTYGYGCKLHPREQGVVVVRD